MMMITMVMVRGVPGVDYPIHNSATATNFSCKGRVPGAYYADPSLDCQVGFGLDITHSFPWVNFPSLLFHPSPQSGALLDFITP